MRIGITLLVVAVLGIGAYVYFWGVPAAVSRLLPAAAATVKSSAPTVDAPIPVAAAVVRGEAVPIYLSGIGTVQAYNTVNVKTRVDGEITKILFQEGQDVKAGDALAIIDPRPLEAQLQQQEAVLQKDQAVLQGALLDLRRFESLV